MKILWLVSKVLPQVGWNKYSEISVEHVSQIVGRKPEKG